MLNISCPSVFSRALSIKKKNKTLSKIARERGTSDRVRTCYLRFFAVVNETLLVPFKCR